MEIFGSNLDDYLHLVVPAVVKFFEQVDAPPVVRALAIQKLGKMAQKLNFRFFFFIPVRVLDAESLLL